MRRLDGSLARVTATRSIFSISACALLTSCTVTTTTNGEHASAKQAPSPHAQHRRAHRAAARPAPPPGGTAEKRDFVGVSTLPEQPPKSEPPRSSLRAALLPAGAGAGRPRGFEPGGPAAYWIWQGPRGGWRIRTTSANAPHTFRGHLAGTTGPVTGIQPSRLELRDRIWQNDDGWAFSFRTSGHADGFTFTIPDNGCVRFDLKLDGGPLPKRIFVGARELEPGTGHFIVCPKGASPDRAR